MTVDSVPAVDDDDDDDGGGGGGGVSDRNASLALALNALQVAAIPSKNPPPLSSPRPEFSSSLPPSATAAVLASANPMDPGRPKTLNGTCASSSAASAAAMRSKAATFSMARRISSASRSNVNRCATAAASAAALSYLQMS